MVNAPLLNLSASLGSKADTAELYVPPAAQAAAVREVPKLLAAFAKARPCALAKA